MDIISLLLVISASFSHATWNLLSKRTKGGIPFIWTIASLSAVIYAPLVIALILTKNPHFGLDEIIFMSGSAFLHLIYFIVLLTGYRKADLSVVYPIARGLGPTLSVIGAVIILGEKPSTIALLGTAFVVTGIIIISSRGNSVPKEKSAIMSGRFFGVLSGMAIASYTIWDKYAVSSVMVYPLILEYSSLLLRMIVLAPIAIKKRQEVSLGWKQHKKETIWVAILNPLAFILVLTAMIASPVSYIAPAREMSILIGVVLGAKYLSEGYVVRRVIASAMIIIGIVALSV
jgi:drug/metabolite transporter (DMT)-like permease